VLGKPDRRDGETSQEAKVMEVRKGSCAFWEGEVGNWERGRVGGELFHTQGLLAIRVDPVTRMLGGYKGH
jgi:hypothetical protein